MTTWHFRMWRERWQRLHRDARPTYLCGSFQWQVGTPLTHRQNFDSNQVTFGVVVAHHAQFNLACHDIGRDFLQRQQTQGWGAKVVGRLVRDLKNAFPEVRG